MAKRKSVSAAMTQYQRERERAYAAEQRAIAKAQRDAERARAAQDRATAAELREAKRRYAESRVAEVIAMNDDLDVRTEALTTLLAEALLTNCHVDFETSKRTPMLRHARRPHSTSP